MFGDIFFFVLVIPLQHAQLWWSRSSDDERETNADRPDASAYGNSRNLDAECPPDASAYVAVVPHMSEPTPHSLENGQQSFSRVECAQEGTPEQWTSSEKGKSKGQLSEAPVHIPDQSHETSIGSATAPAMITPSISRSGRRSGEMGHIDDSNSTLQSSLDGPKPHEPQVYRWQLGQPNSKAPVSHEIWHPPLSVYEGSVDVPERSETRRLPHPRSRRSSATEEATPPHTEPRTSGTFEVEEWRLYPPFPSAYPPTPLPAPVKLPSVTPNTANSTSRRPSDKVHFPPITEENEHPFGQSLMPREPSNPGSDASVSDDKLSTTGVQNHDSSSDKDSMDVDSEDEDSDDFFDITLRTPRRKRTTKLPARRTQSKSVSSVSSSKLTTVDNGSTLRTRSSSESTSSMSFSDTSSIVGHKRSFPEVDAVDLQKTVKPMEKTHTKEPPKSRKLTSQFTTSRTVWHPNKRQDNTSASDTADDSESENGDSLETKRRRLAEESRENGGSSSSNLRKNDGVHERPVADGPPAATRGRGRGRGQAPSRTSSRIANSRTLPQFPRSTSTSSNSSQTTQTGNIVPPLRDKQPRKRT